MAKVIIFGLGDLAAVAHLSLTGDTAHEVVGFTVEEPYRSVRTFQGLPTFPFEGIEREMPPGEVSMLVATGPSRANGLRARLYGEAKTKGYELITYISPKAIVSPDVPIGDNCFIFFGAILDPFTSVGNNSTIWSGSVVAHHSSIGNHCFLAAGVAVSGRVVVEDYCFLGSNSTVRDYVRLGTRTVVGAGALITKHTEPSSVYASPRSYRYADDSSQVKL